MRRLSFFFSSRLVKQGPLGANAVKMFIPFFWPSPVPSGTSRQSLVPGLGFVFGQVGRELADEELLKEIFDGAAGDAEGGVFEG